MSSRFAQLAFTPGVQRHQRENGSARAYRPLLDGPVVADRLGEAERQFVRQRDSFYLASVGETGWPYVQHRGGPPGFLKVVDDGTLGFADFRGNRQYITLGNLDHDNRVALFLMDYGHQARMKIMGRARAVEDPALLAGLTVPGYRAKVERAVLIEVEAFDWNCRQHIPRLVPLDAVEHTLTSLQERIAELERQNTELRRTGMTVPPGS
ncbi:pyridoxamine 5'-phosphate oxidase family protein [Spirillospora sp. NPDC048824]|uniref:pyridoxamine 5'-phosphate oxidase family protein n=1 Tax=Spirillospora sp. NPDC048824 TaxID=3364526 RepID=UPI0037170976